MVGAPCSGKSMWIKNNLVAIRKRHGADVIIVSRDVIRESLFGKKYVHNGTQERVVTKRFYELLGHALTLTKATIIIDNCNMSSFYLSDLLKTVNPMMLSGKLEFFIQYLEISYMKAYWRNIKRRILTGKWIPLKILRDFYVRYNELREDKYFRAVIKSGAYSLWKTNLQEKYS